MRASFADPGLAHKPVKLPDLSKSSFRGATRRQAQNDTFVSAGPGAIPRLLTSAGTAGLSGSDEGKGGHLGDSGGALGVAIGDARRSAGAACLQLVGLHRPR